MISPLLYLALLVTFIATALCNARELPEPTVHCTNGTHAVYRSGVVVGCQRREWSP